MIRTRWLDFLIQFMLRGDEPGHTEPAGGWGEL
jgi:hypothetical protein